MLQINCLGKLETQLNGSPLYQLTSTKNKKKFLLLAYLWEQKELQTRDHLAQIFWPDGDTALGMRSLNTLIFRLRKDGLKDYIHSSKFHLLLTNQLRPIEFDLDHFRQLSKDITPYSTLDQLEAPFKLFHGSFLADLDLSDLPEVADWAYTIQHEIETKLILTYRMLAPRLIDAGMVVKGAEYGHVLTTFVREDELTWEWLVRCLIAQGDVAQALQMLGQYRQEALAKDPTHRFSASLLELGGQLSDPSQVANLIQSGQEIKLDRAQNQLAKSNATQYITPLSEVIGRGSDRNLLLELLNQEHRVISVVGLGGVGKTTLIRSLIPDLLQRFDHHVFFVELHPNQQPDSSLPDTDRLIRAISQVLNIQETEPDKLIKIISGQLNDQSTCLILDNFESVKEGAIGLGKLVDQIAGLTVLITSRTRLNLRLEAALQLNGLPLREDSDRLDQAGPAQRLFERTAQRQSPTFKLTEDNRAAVSELCLHLDGLPLAIELMTQQLHIYSVRELISRSQASGHFLQSNMIDVREEHQSIHQLLKTMWQTLSERAQAVLPELTRFANEWSTEAMEAIVPAERAIYNELLNTSMLQQVAPGQFKLHPLIKQFAANHKHDERDALLIFDSEKSDVEVYQSANSYEKGLTYAQDQDTELRFDLLAGIIRSRLVLQQDLPELIPLAERLVDLAIELEDKQKQIKAQAFHSRCYGRIGQFNKAIEILEQALPIAYDHENFLTERAIIHYYIADELKQVNRIKEALEHVTACYSIMQYVDEPDLQLRLNLLECNLQLESGEFDKALNKTFEYVESCRQQNYVIEECKGLNLIVLIYAVSGEREKQLQVLYEMVEKAQKIGSGYIEHLGRLNLGVIQSEVGLFEESLKNLTIAQNGFLASSNIYNLAHVFGPLADVYFETEQFELAEEMYVKSINLLAQTDANIHDLAAHLIYSHFLIECDRLDEAEQELKKAEQLFSDNMRPTIMTEINCAKSWIWCQSGRKEETLSNLEELFTNVNKFDLDGEWPILLNTVLFFICILETLEDDRAGDLLNRAYKSIYDESEKFNSAELRESYLLNLRVHQKIFELYKQRFGAELHKRDSKSPLT